MRTLEYKIKAKPQQFKAIDDAIRTVQFVRNKALRFWIDAPRELKLSRFDLTKYSTSLRRTFKFVEDLNAQAVQASAERAWLAIERFYNNCKTKKPGKKGYPKFQHDNRSVEYKSTGWKLHPTRRIITFTDDKNIGRVKLLGKWHVYRLPHEMIKRVRIVKRADGYYCQFVVDIKTAYSDLQPATGNEIGLDVGLQYFYTDSNGHHEPNPRFLRKAEPRIKKAQRAISKKKKGSSGRKKARAIYARKHLKVSRQRVEHAKRLARNVSKSNDLVAYEDLNVSNMVKNHKLAKSISDASWYQFRVWLEHFASKFNRVVVAVAPHFTSQECSNCGEMVKKSQSTRTHICRCGCILQRDYNAAINILNKARDGQSQSNARGVEINTLLGENLVGQISTMNLESSHL